MIHAVLRACGVLVLALGLSVSAHAKKEYGDEKYTPERGQHGKDVIWVPTPNEMITKMLTAAKVTSRDIVYDLGAGDGKIAIAAAREFGARAVGIEYNPEMAALARRNVERAGLASRVRIITGDIFVENFSEATVVTLYLLPTLNLKLRPTLLAMKPGTRVVSHSFDMDEWEPDQRLETSDAHGYFWVVPARVDGRWTLQIPGTQGETRLQLRQSFQKLEGDLFIDGRKVAIERGRMNGDEMVFFYPQVGGERTVVSVRVNGDRLSGRVFLPDARLLDISGRRP